MPQVVGKHLSSLNPCLSAELLHLLPNTPPVHRPSISCDKYTASAQFSLLTVCFQKANQRVRQQNHPFLSFAANMRHLLLQRLHCDIRQLTYADACRSYGLQNAAQTFFPQFLDSIHQTAVFLTGQFPLLTAKNLPLNPAHLNPAFRAANKFQIAI